MIGDVINPSRPRFEDNERLDVVDAEAFSLSSRLHQDVQTKSLLFTPKATAGVPVGLILTGGSVTAPGGGIVRIGSELLAALDADGRSILKPSGTTVDVAIPDGGAIYNVYLYYNEDPAELARRRFITVTAPYTEESDSINTKFAATFGVHVYSGAILASDVVAGQTRALAFLCQASNMGGVVTLYPTASTNKMSSLPAEWAATPPTFPANNYTHSSAKTSHELEMIQAWQHARTKFGKAGAWTTQYLPGTSVVPAAANNWGAYTEPRRGLDAVDRASVPQITIGNGTTSFGDFDTNRYASGDLCLAAAFAALSASGGGTIFIKSGVLLTLAADVTMVVGAGSTVTIKSIGHANLLGFASGIACSTFKFILTNSGARASFAFDGVVLSGDGTLIQVDKSELIIRDCVIATSGTAAAIKGGVTAAPLLVQIENNQFYSSSTTAHAPATTAFIDFTAFETSDIHIVGCRFWEETYVRTHVAINMGSNVQIKDCDFSWLTDTADIGVPTAQPSFIVLTTTGTATKQRGRVVESCGFRGAYTNASASNFSAVRITGASYVKVVHCFFDHCKTGVFFDGAAESYNRVLDCTSYSYGATNALTCRGVYGTCVASEFEVANSVFSFVWGGGVVWAVVGTLFNLDVSHCTFDTSPLLVAGISVNGCSFTHNTFVGIDGTVPPFIWGSTEIKQLTWSHNLHTGHANSVTNDAYLGVRFQGGQIIGAEIEDNHFSNLQNVVFTGGVTWFPRIIEIDTNHASGVVVRGNIVSDVAHTLTGTNSVVPTLVEIESYDRATLPTNDGGSVIIEKNVIGPDSLSSIGTCKCSLAVLGAASKFYLSKLVIQDNTVTGIFNTPGGTEPGWTDTCFGVYIALATDAAGYFSFEGNEFYIVNNTAANISGSICKLVQKSVASWIRVARFCDNTIRLSGGWIFANYYGIWSEWNYRNFVLENNVATNDDNDLSCFFFNASAAGATRTITASHTQPPALPVSGFAFDDNIGVNYRNA